VSKSDLTTIRSPMLDPNDGCSERLQILVETGMKIPGLSTTDVGGTLALNNSCASFITWRQCIHVEHCASFEYGVIFLGARWDASMLSASKSTAVILAEAWHTWQSFILLFLQTPIPRVDFQQIDPLPSQYPGHAKLNFYVPRTVDARTKCGSARSAC